MSDLKLLWTDVGGTPFKGSKGIIRDWGDEMRKKGWTVETDPSKWEECDLIFYSSDAQLHEVPAPLGKKPTILYFWGWEPGKLLDREFQKIAGVQLGMMAQCDRILTPSPIVMDQIACFGLPSYVCLPGVNSSLLDWGLGEVVPKNSNRIMFLSRLVPHKQLEALIQAVSIIRPMPELLVVGPGDTKPYQGLADQLQVPVIFKELDETYKVDALRESAILVHPSSYEGFGLPPLEALYCKTPVIAFDIPQMRWLLQEDAYYFSTVDDLANSIIYILSHPDEAQLKADRGSERIGKSLTLEHACERLWGHIGETIKLHLSRELRDKPGEWGRIYDDEHRRNWTFGASGFDPTWERHWRAQAYLEELKNCKAEKVLDIGCGPVYPTILARAGYTVTAVDISGECIRQVMNIAKKWEVDGKVFARTMDANALEYSDNSFDAVIQGEIWEHVPDVGKIISEGLRVLKPGGSLIASTPIGTHHYDLMHLRVFNDQSIKELLDYFNGVAEISTLEKIAEEGTDPSCYFVVLKKL